MIDTLTEAFNSTWRTISTVWVNMLLGFTVVGLGAVFSKIAALFFRKLANKMGLDKLFEYLLGEVINRHTGMRLVPSLIISSFVYFLLTLFFITVGFNIMAVKGLDIALNDLVNLVPKLFACVVLVLASSYAGEYLKKLIIGGLSKYNVEYRYILGKVAKVATVMFGLIIATRQLDFGIEVLSTAMAVLIVIAVCAGVFILAYGFKDAVRALVGGYYVRRYYKQGDTFTINGESFSITKIGDLNTILHSSDKTISIPNQKIIKDGFTL